MDLEKINPKAYAMWKFLYDRELNRFEKCIPKKLQNIEENVPKLPAVHKYTLKMIMR